MNPFQRAGYGLMRLMARLMPSCKDVAALISQGMDARLPLRKRVSIRVHVSLCALCRRYAKQLQMLHHGLRRYADPDQNPFVESLSPTAKQKLNSTLEGGGE